MKITEIKNEELRKLVETSNDSIKFEVSPKSLLDLDWVFDDAIDYIEEFYNVSTKEAEKIFDDEHIIYLSILRINETEIHTVYEINNMKDHLSNVSNGVSFDTGDDEATISDIVFLDLF